MRMTWHSIVCERVQSGVTCPIARLERHVASRHVADDVVPERRDATGAVKGTRLIGSVHENRVCQEHDRGVTEGRDCYRGSSRSRE